MGGEDHVGCGPRGVVGGEDQLRTRQGFVRVRWPVEFGRIHAASLMMSPSPVNLALLGWLLAGVALSQADKGAQSLLIRDPQGREVGWYDGSYALLIGVSDYTAGWPDLESVPGELAEVRTTLEAHGFEVETAPDDPTKGQLRAAVESFIDAHGFGGRNRLLIFYSGHGHSFEGDNRGFLVPSDAPNPRVDPIGFQRKAIPMSDVMAWARRIRAPHVLFLFDSCFSGTVFEARSLPEIPPHIADATARPVRQFISAGSAGQTVPAKSVFTPHFTRALGGEGDLNGDGYVTGTELGLYLHEKVAAYDQGQTPQYGKIRDPDLDEGDFVFRLPRRPVPAPLPPLPVASAPTTEDLMRRADEIEANRKRWAEWLAGLSDQVTEAEAFERREVPAELKAEFWQRLVDGYAEDDPYSAEDETLRAHARERLDHWRKAARVPPPPPASSDPGSGEPSAGDLLEDPKTGIRLRWIPHGRFQMGSPPGEEGHRGNETLHEVELTRGFWMGETEVTQGQWSALMGNNPSRFSSCGDDCPVEVVSWWDAVAFANQVSSKAGLERCYTPIGCTGTPGIKGYACQRVVVEGPGCEGYRLPTEAEWERAARAGTQTPFWTGENLTTDQANFDGNYPYAGSAKGVYRQKTVKVGSFSANRWGLHDVHGNVFEWVWDWYGTYPTKLEKDPVGPDEGARRVFRGGSWDALARGVRAASRDGHPPAQRGRHLGFRLSRGPEQ